MTRKQIGLAVSVAAVIAATIVVFGLLNIVSRHGDNELLSSARQKDNLRLTPSVPVTLSLQQENIDRLRERLEVLGIPIVYIKVLEEKPFRIAVRIKSNGPSSGNDTGTFEDVFYERVVYREALISAKKNGLGLDSLETSFLGNDGRPIVTVSGEQEQELVLISNFNSDTYSQLSIDVPPSSVDDSEVTNELSKVIEGAASRDGSKFVIAYGVTVTQNGVTENGQFVDISYQVGNYTAVNWDLPVEIEHRIEKLNSERGASIRLLRLRIETLNGSPICEYVSDYLLGSGHGIRSWTITEDMEWPGFSSPPVGAKLPFRKSAYPPK
jgi:hypothetical protein